MRRTARVAAAASLAAACWALPTAAFADDSGSDPAHDVVVVSVEDDASIMPIDDSEGAPGDPAADPDPDMVFYSLPLDCVAPDDTTDRIPCEWHRDVTCPDDTATDPCPVYTTDFDGPAPSQGDTKAGGDPEGAPGGAQPENAPAEGGADTSAGGGDSNDSGSSATDGDVVVLPAPGGEESAVDVAPEPQPSVDGAAPAASAPADDKATTSAQSTTTPSQDSGAPLALVLGAGALAAAGVAGAAVAVRRRMSTN